MFKKRLKGLLAMLLAGSIATTALPLTASATISGNISVVGGTGGTIDPSGLPGCLPPYVDENNLWAIYSSDGNSTCTGDQIGATLQGYRDSGTSYGEMKVRYFHDILFTTNDITGGTAVKRSDMQSYSVSSFPYNISYAVSLPADPLKEVTWTAWYNRDSGNNLPTYEYTSGNCTQSSTYIDKTDTKISADVIKALYQGNDSVPINYGKTIIELKTAYKTFDIPVLTTLGEEEMNGNTPKTIAITQGNNDSLDAGNEFYLCYDNKALEGEVDSVDGVWGKIETLANEKKSSFDSSKLKLLRYAKVTVISGGEDKGVFTSGEYYNYRKSGKTNNDAIKYAFSVAKPKSIWGISGNYFSGTYYILQVNLAQKFGEILHSNPDETTIWLNEITSVYVTGEVPSVYGTIPEGSYFESPLLKNGSPATISNHAAKLTVSNPPASGKKYDTTGWQLWKGSKSGSSFQFDSQINVGTGVNSIGVDQIKAAEGADLIIYFPQVNASSSGGSGGSSSRPTTPSYDPNKPTIDGEEKSWSDVAKDIGKFSEGETKTITLGRDKKIPADVIKAIKDSKAVITFRINSAFNWTVDGSKLTDGDIHDYDFSIEVVTATGTEILRGDVGVGFKIGDISDGATLNINFKKEHAQKFANLYKNVDGELVFVDNVMIDENGAAIGLKVSESGEYVVMLGEMSDRPGDIDNDGIMNAKDALAALKHSVGMEKGKNPVVGDMNGDGDINAKDALFILKKSVGMI